ncbi:MAG: hypothetical protein JWP48_1812 [Actinoallomurus sp.]|jgi:hypothetical protein|nr:hypothetical protein [Actinoallomurus sp.]
MRSHRGTPVPPGGGIAALARGRAGALSFGDTANPTRPEGRTGQLGIPARGRAVR